MNPTGATTHVPGVTDRRSASAEGSGREPVLRAAWFAGLSLALAAGTVAAGTPPALTPFVLAIGPMLIALALAWHEGHGALRRLARSLAIRPADRRWYLVLAIPVGWALATVAVAVALGEPTAGLFDTLLPAVLVVPLVVLLPAFGEELAWRGYALPRLMSAMSPLAAALLLAVPWAIVHVVLFLPGQWYEDLALWPMLVSIVAYSILLAWIFVGTGGSVLMAALFHAGLNGMAPVMAGVDGDASWAIRSGIAALLAAGVVALGGLRRTADRS
jgi:membrane protease YdiL (CAAX protease family)